MTYVDVNMFLKNTEMYIDLAKKGYNVYICLEDGTELKLERFIR